MKTQHTTLMFMIMAIFLINIVSAQQELSITYPKNQAFPQNTEITLRFQVFNSTSHVLNSGMVNCEFLAYNLSDGLLSQQNTTFHANNIDVLASLNTDHTKDIGDYPYTIICDSTDGESGFLSGYYTVTSDGRVYTENSTLMPMILFIFGTIGVLYWFSSVIQDGQFEQGLKLFLNLIGLALLIVASGYMLISLQVMNVSQNSYTFASTMHFVLMITLFTIIALFMWIFITKLIDWIRNLKKPVF